MKRHASSEGRIHPSPVDLLRFLDDELADGDLSSVRRHLMQCQECRETVHRFSSVTLTFSKEPIAELLVERKPPFAKAGPVPADHSSIAHHHEFGCERLRVSKGWRSPSFAAFPRTAAASVAVAVVGAILMHFLLSPPRLSARSVVDIAWREQRERQANSSALQIERILRVTWNAEGVPARTEHWSSRVEPQTSSERLIAGIDGAEEIFASLPHASCRVFVPLSLEMLGCLLDKERQPAILEEIHQGAAIQGYRIDLSASEPDRHSFRSQWTIERTNWRLSKVEFEFHSAANGVRILIEEEAVRAYRAAPAKSSIPASARVPSPSPASAPDRVFTRAPGVESARSRLRAFEIIATFQPMPEEDLRIRELPGGTVRLEGTVQGEERRTMLREILRSAPEVASAVHTQEELIERALAENAKRGQGSSLSSNAETEPPAFVNREMRSEGPLLISELEEHFGNDEKGKAIRLRFSERVSSLTQDLAFHAAWLHRLENAFPDSELARLNAAQRERFNNLRDRWLRSVSWRYEQLQAAIRPVLCVSGCEVGQGSEGSDSVTASGRDALSLAEALRTELGLVKTMFVDRAYLPLDSGAGAKARWAFASAAVLEAMNKRATPSLDRSLAKLADPQTSTDPSIPLPNDVTNLPVLAPR